jgi:hypothetical protein
MKMPKIEKGIPLPPPRRKYPWAECEIGDSFLGSLNAGGAMDSWNRKHDSQFIGRKVGKKMRFWRIK